MPQLAPSAKNLATIAFARRLAERLEHGIYPVEAIRQIADEYPATGDTHEAKIRTAAHAVADSMTRGEFGWPEQAETFGEQFVSAVTAGDMAGEMATALKRTADNLEAEIRNGYTDAAIIRLINSRIAFARRVGDSVKLVTLSRALHLVAEEFKQTGTEEDATMAAAAESIIIRIKEGAGPYVWHEWQPVFGAHLVNMVATGTHAHEISQALHDAADTYESDLRALLIPMAALNAELAEHA